MRKILLFSFLFISCISVAHSNVITTAAFYSAPFSKDDKDFCKVIAEIIKKIKKDNAGDIKIGDDDSFSAMEDFETPYFNWRPYGPHFYELSYRYRVSSNEDLLKLYEKYWAALDGCKGLKAAPKKEDKVSKSTEFIYSKEVSVMLKADTYHTRLVIYVFREH